MKTIIISGISQGLGKAICDIILSNSDSKIVGISRNNPFSLENRLEFIRKDLSQKLDVSFFDHLDVPDDQEVIFVLNAASIDPIVQVSDLHECELNLTLNVENNVILLSKFISVFKSYKKIKIINITSGASLKAVENWSLYCSSKAFMRMFCDVIKAENENIEVHHFDPGVLDTRMQKTIRSSNFPDVERFREYKDKGLLKSTSQVAIELFNNWLL